MHAELIGVYTRPMLAPDAFYPPAPVFLAIYGRQRLAEPGVFCTRPHHVQLYPTRTRVFLANCSLEKASGHRPHRRSFKFTIGMSPF